MEKRIIGIITQLSLDSVNFGNYLQAYALNRYINKNYSGTHATTLLIKEKTGIKFTTVSGIIHYYFLRLKRKVYRSIHEIRKVEGRLDRFRAFAHLYINLSDHELTMSEIDKNVYDAMIVGSDVVWYQTPGVIDLPRYLPFYNNTKRRYSYAASFGNENIPPENIKLVRKYLGRFEKISVRESSAAKMLTDIGISNVTHVCDPTMLLTKSEWRSISKKPHLIDEQNIKEYVFAYFLGNSEQQIEKLKPHYEKQGIRVLYIPYINGLIGKHQPKNIDLIDCSPQEWIWLIDNAELVVTDSFHGLVFSVLFGKSFISIRRVFLENINSRIVDLLKTISAEDKLISIDDIEKTDTMTWKSDEYAASVQDFIERSKRYLDTIIGE